jgi:hypothetical protein
VDRTRIVKIAHTDPVVHAAAKAVYDRCRALYCSKSTGADREFRDFVLEQFAKFNVERNEEIALLRSEIKAMLESSRSRDELYELKKIAGL